MSAGIPYFSTLKARQRDLREGCPKEFALRIHRSISWIGRAEHEVGDSDAAFMFLWIAFNAGYGGERFTFRAWDDFEATTSKASAGSASPVRSTSSLKITTSLRRSGGFTTVAEDWEGRSDAIRCITEMQCRKTSCR